MGLRCSHRSRSSASLAGRVDQHAIARAGAFHRRGIHHSANIARAASVGEFHCLWPRMGSELDIFSIYVGLRESVWVVLVPVQLTELIFPNLRNQPWLKKSGLITSSLVFVLGSFIAWFLWTQIARPRTFHVPKYQPPFFAIFSGALSILLLAFAAYALRNVGQHPSRAQPTSSTPSPWTVGLATLVFGFPWYLLMSLIFGPRRDIALWIPIIAGIVWASVAFFVIQRWVSSLGWRDIHRWALVFSATLVCMIAGFSGSSTWPRMDIISKAILNVFAIAGFIWLALKISRPLSRNPSNLGYGPQ